MAEDIPEPQPQVEVSPEAAPPPPTPPRVAYPSLALQIWPPTQRTRDAVRSRLVENLSSPSVLTKRYGAFPIDEASTVARRIEEEAFGAASASAAADAGSVDEGIEVIQIYSKEISKRMLEAVKARAPAPAESSPGSVEVNSPPATSAADDATGEEASAAESDSPAS
ncbi:WPP domain-containing protein [Dioscorea alata]|uniref:WPP domain-containing protein n=1 Tax=Dioscorea alata TaxID=55571 RepID=A0ACB7TWM1_DIOAL|nr:WPP domain-containing protein [Dioscorea alata]